MYDLLVRGGTVVSPTAAEPLDVAVEGERIAADRPSRSARLRGEEGDRRDRVSSSSRAAWIRTSTTASASAPCARSRRSTRLRPRSEARRRSSTSPSGRGRRPCTRRSRRRRRRRRAAWPSTTASTRSRRQSAVRGARGDRGRDPRRNPDDQDADDVRLDVGRRPPLRDHERGRRARRPFSIVHAEDDAIANWLTRSTCARGRPTAPTSPRPAGPLVEEAARAARACCSPSGQARRSTSSMSPPARLPRRSRKAEREGLPVYGETIARVPLLHRRQALGRREPRAALEQLSGDQVPGGPGRPLGGGRRRSHPGRQLRSLHDDRCRPLREDGRDRGLPPGGPGEPSR